MIRRFSVKISPVDLMPKKLRPTPRYGENVLESIQKELFKPKSERQLPISPEQRKIREFACTPDKVKIGDSKGKLKPTIKKRLLDFRANDLDEVEYVAPRKPRVGSTDAVPSRRQHRMSFEMWESIDLLLTHALADDGPVNRTDFSITRVEASNDLSRCVVFWYPLKNIGEEKEMIIAELLESHKKEIRWKITDKFSYLRRSPEIIFSYDFVARQKEAAEKVFEEVEESVQ